MTHTTTRRRSTRRALAIGLTAAALCAHPLAAHAIPLSYSSWTVTTAHDTIYSDGTTAALYFMAPPSTKFNGRITGVSVTVQPYANGRTEELFQVCYQKPYTANDYLCNVAENIGTQPITKSVNAFNGQDPRGSISIKHTLKGGTFPAYGNSIKDSVTTSYSYTP